MAVIKYLIAIIQWSFRAGGPSLREMEFPANPHSYPASFSVSVTPMKQLNDRYLFKSHIGLATFIAKNTNRLLIDRGYARISEVTQ